MVFCGFFRFQFRLPRMKCEAETEAEEANEGERRRKENSNLCLIFGRSSNASGCVLTLAFPLSLPFPLLFSPLPSWRSVRVTAWQKATGYEFFITFSHCNKVGGEEGRRESQGQRGNRNRNRSRQTEGITFM